MAAQLKPGDKAPAFSAESIGESTVSLSDFAGKKNVALFFYVRDNTPGCTREARAFRDAEEQLGRRNTVVIGVSTNGLASHERFAANQELEFPLLADTEGKIAEAYGVLRKGAGMATRATFLIDKEGVVRRVWPKVSITGHTNDVIAAIDELGLA
jgi:peroxiredoxin Q/BCP